jgi:hypothetical protein
MCNLYSVTTNQEAIRALFRVINRYVGNLPPMPGVFPWCRQGRSGSGIKFVTARPFADPHTEKYRRFDRGERMPADWRQATP